MKVEFCKHNVGDEEKKMVMECLDGLFLTTGSYVKTFESELAAYLGVRHAVGVMSCTSALHISLLALGVQPGDEVITTPMTFIATATTIIHAGARPVFVDVDPETALIDPERIEQAITPKTKVIVPVHLYGRMCDMVRIHEIADARGLKIIEDAAHCVEGRRQGYSPGQLGNMACFSFYAIKNITSGEGGAIATNDDDLDRKLRLLRLHGMSKGAADRYSSLHQHWDMLTCGWKCNMSNIQGAMLIPQLRRIDALWEKRHRLYLKYRRALENIPGIRLLKDPPESRNAHHLFTILVNPEHRDAILMELGKAGIGVAVNYRAIHLLTYFRETFGFQRGDFPNAEHIGDSTISIPFYPGLTDAEADYVVETLRNVTSRRI